MNQSIETAKKNEKDRLNELDGSTWLQWSKSIWRFKKPVLNNYGHPAIFPTFVAERLIKIFTKENDLVLDPMVGVGTTSVAAKLLNRQSIGIDLSPEYCKIAKSRLAQQRLIDVSSGTEASRQQKKNEQQHKIICDDARNLLLHVIPESVDFCLTSPPYWIGLHGINGKYTGQTKKQVKVYSKDNKDYGNVEDYEKFVRELKNLFSDVYKVLKSGKYCVVNNPRFTTRIQGISFARGFSARNEVCWVRLSGPNCLGTSHIYYSPSWLSYNICYFPCS